MTYDDEELDEDSIEKEIEGLIDKLEDQISYFHPLNIFKRFKDKENKDG